MTDAELFMKMRAAFRAAFRDAEAFVEAAADRIEAQAAEIERLTEDRERLALAICGGEDAPGYANAQTVETLEKVARDNHNATMEQVNYTLAAEAKLAKAADVIDWALSAWDDHNKHGDNMQGDWVHDARTTLAELKGQDDE